MRKKLENIANFINREIGNELEQQGHILSGDIRNVDNKYIPTGDGWRIEGYMQHYARYLERGVSPDSIPYKRGSGAKTSKFIDALEEYARKRGMDKPLSAAFAIATKMKKEGMPTKGSYGHSKNGRRKDFLQVVFDTKQTEIDTMIQQAGFNELETTMDNIIANAQKEAQTATA